ncbi:MAG: hypothetical protein RIF33_09475 [Cyclobacteriaceae bacterium]
METSTIFNVTGLALDFIGVIVLFFYEPPRQQFGILLESAPSEEELEKVFKLKRKMSRIGLLMLAIGFILQIVGNLL